MKVTFPLSICVISLKFVSILKVCHSKRHIFLASVHLGMGVGVGGGVGGSEHFSDEVNSAELPSF